MQHELLLKSIDNKKTARYIPQIISIDPGKVSLSEKCNRFAAKCVYLSDSPATVSDKLEMVKNKDISRKYS